MRPLLRIAGLHVRVVGPDGPREVVRDVDLDVAEGEAVGLVGESGSGKSMTARAVLRLLPHGATAAGTIEFDGRDVLGMAPTDLRQHRGRDVAIIFQDPRAHTNPVHTIGHFLTEGIRLLEGVGRHEADERAVELLRSVRIDRPEQRMRQYPHEVSGGMLQRVMIAAALAQRPRLLLADEPTTALDVTVQAEVMAILAELRRETGLAMLFITHDLELAAATCDRTAVMYAGSVVEVQESHALHASPQHPYTKALLSSRPEIDGRLDRLRVIPGQAATAFEEPVGCSFAKRCDVVVDRCRSERPSLQRGESVAVACWNAGPGRG